MEALRELADQAHLCLLQPFLLLEEMEVQGLFSKAVGWRRAAERRESEDHRMVCAGRSHIAPSPLPWAGKFALQEG